MKFMKFFSHEKCLDSFILNVLGFQGLRYVVGKLIFWFKYNFFPIDKNNIKKFNQILNLGFDSKTNFLSDYDFNKLKEEFFLAIDNSIDEKQGENISIQMDEGLEYKTLYINETFKDKYPTLFWFKNHSFIKDYFVTCEQKKDYDLYCRLEKILVKNDNTEDPNKDYHFDTFHNTFKCWLFIDKVEKSQGPFRYLPNSNKFSLKRLFFEWKESIKYSLDKKVNASFRTNKNYKNKLDKKSVLMQVNENTLVMANTHGLHRRGDASIGTTRYAIQFWTRENPFKLIKI